MVLFTGCLGTDESKEIILHHDSENQYGITEITSFDGKALLSSEETTSGQLYEHICVENTITEADYVNLYFRILPKEWDKRKIAYALEQDPEADYNNKKENHWKEVFSKVLYLDTLFRENEPDSVLRKCMLSVKKKNKMIYEGPAAQAEALKICRIDPGKKTDISISFEIPENLSEKEKNLLKDIQPTLIAMELNEKVEVGWEFENYNTEGKNIKKPGDILKFTVTVTNTGNTDILNSFFEEFYNDRWIQNNFANSLKPTAYQQLGGWWQKVDPDPMYGERWAYMNELDGESGCHVIHLVFTGFPDNPDLRDQEIRIEKDMEYYLDDGQ